MEKSQISLTSLISAMEQLTMDYMALWITSLMAALLIVTVALSLSKRYRKLTLISGLLLSLVPIATGIAATLFTMFIFTIANDPKWAFPYFGSWTALLIAGTALLCIKWNSTPKGIRWPRGKLALGLALALGLTVFAFQNVDDARREEAMASRSRSQATIDNLTPVPPAEGQNAKPIYDRAVEALGKAPEWLDQSLDAGFDPLSPKALNLLEENREALQLFKEASRKPKFFFSVTSWGDELPPMGPYKRATYLLGLEARVHARNGNWQSAWDNLATLERMAEHQLQSPHLLTALMADAFYHNWKNTLEFILSQYPGKLPPNSQLPLETHHRLMQAIHDGLDFEMAGQHLHMMDSFYTQGSVHWMLSSVDETGKLSEPLNPAHKLLDYLGTRLYRVFLFKYDHDFNDWHWGEVSKFTAMPFYEGKPGLLAHDAAFMKKEPYPGFLSAITIPQFSSYYDRTARKHAGMLAGKLALATAAYRSDHGKYPASLEALVPKYITEVPTDPFSGEPMKMLSVKNGLILYSVGPDMKDDQGTAFDRDSEEGDLCFYLGSAFKEHRLKPAQEAQAQKKGESD